MNTLIYSAFAFLFLVATPLSHADVTLGATYTVPTADPSLKPFATYSVPTEDENGSTYEVRNDLIRFKLPRALTGLDQSFTLFSDASGQWTGFGIKASCKPEKSEMKCSVQFDRMDIDLNAAEIELKRIGKSTVEIQKHLKISEIFWKEPIGVVTLQIPNRN